MLTFSVPWLLTTPPRIFKNTAVTVVELIVSVPPDRIFKVPTVAVPLFSIITDPAATLSPLTTLTVFPEIVTSSALVGNALPLQLLATFQLPPEAPEKLMAAPKEEKFMHTRNKTASRNERVRRDFSMK